LIEPVDVCLNAVPHGLTGDLDPVRFLGAHGLCKASSRKTRDFRARLPKAPARVREDARRKSGR
jgi:hypothetical protein